MSRRVISLRGVEVHNLRRINLELPQRQLIIFCGLSGSGKSSLAFDTLYAEGQRRYIETFSAYTRQFLERLEKPAVERIDGLPPAVAVAARSPNRSNRSTVGTVTETNDYLRLLFAKIGQIVCRQCGRTVDRDSPDQVAAAIIAQPPGVRFLIAFRVVDKRHDPTELVRSLRENGFLRVIVGQRSLHLEQASVVDTLAESPDAECWVVVDRLTSDSIRPERLRDSIETAFRHGNGACITLHELSTSFPAALHGQLMPLDDSTWLRCGWSQHLRCEDCGIDYLAPEPRLFSFNHPLGACPTCEGFGNVIDLDFDRIIPDPSKSLREGAIAPWNTPAYAHELRELLALAKDYDLPVDIPYYQLDERHRALITHGVQERDFGGLDGFFAWLERRKYKMHIRVFLSRWRSYRVCPTCQGMRLNPESLATRIGGLSIADVCALKVSNAREFFEHVSLTDTQRVIGKMMLDQVRSRLGYLSSVGLGYLTLDRSLRTLSGGEAQRVGLTTALGSSLVNMLYVLDEPSIGLHPHDTDQLIHAVRGLQRRGNTVVVVEHEEAMIRAADQIVEIGPGAGECGGQIVFQGTLNEMLHETSGSITGDFLAGRRLIATPERRRKPNHGWIRLTGARANNLQNLTVEFPLGLLCVVTGVSGSGKSTLVTDTLYPALCRRMHKEAERPAEHDAVYGDGQLEDVILVDQSPIGRSPRSNPVTYVKAFDEIRAAFADTTEARTRNYSASHFSFNVEGGRCPACEGDGVIAVDMQFLADIYMKCSQCNGLRYRREILEIVYRGRTIADVLEMTVCEAYLFFRSHPKVQTRLKLLIDVGLEYLRLGQAANTLSGGESQRLKLAAYLSSAKRGRCLFILDEPTTGLHFADIIQLLDCFDALLNLGHSLIVIEHNLHLLRTADYLIDLGPGAAEQGGRVLATGTPEQVARVAESLTGRYLAASLAEAAGTVETTCDHQTS